MACRYTVSAICSFCYYRNWSGIEKRVRNIAQRQSNISLSMVIWLRKERERERERERYIKPTETCDSLWWRRLTGPLISVTLCITSHIILNCEMLLTSFYTVRCFSHHFTLWDAFQIIFYFEMLLTSFIHCELTYLHYMSFSYHFTLHASRIILHIV